MDFKEMLGYASNCFREADEIRSFKNRENFEIADMLDNIQSTAAVLKTVQDYTTQDEFYALIRSYF